MKRFWVGLLWLSITACEIETHSSRPPAGPPPPGAPPPGAPPGVPPAPAPSGQCTPGSVCFRILPAGPGALGPGRLILFWTPPGDDDAVPPEISTLASLSGTESMVVLPLANIPRPTRTIQMGQAWGYVFVLPASDPSQNPKHASGAPNMMFVHVMGAAAQQGVMQRKFPSGLAEGTAPYFMQKPATGHDNFLLAPPGSVFDLRICPANSPDCDVPFPNPS